MNKRVGILILFSIISFGYPQTDYYFNYNLGYFIQHSENSMPITYQDDFQRSTGFSGGIDYPITNGKYLQINFGYSSAKLPYIQDVLNSNGELLYTKKYGELTEEAYPLDIRLFISKTKMTGFGYGLTIIGTNHSLVLDRISGSKFRDIFNSTGLGINGIWRLSYGRYHPTYLISDIILRYVKAIRFNGGHRDFSNYNYNYLQISVSLGIGRKH